MEPGDLDDWIHRACRECGIDVDGLVLSIANPSLGWILLDFERLMLISKNEISERIKSVSVETEPEG